MRYGLWIDSFNSLGDLRRDMCISHLQTKAKIRIKLSFLVTACFSLLLASCNPAKDNSHAVSIPQEPLCSQVRLDGKHHARPTNQQIISWVTLSPEKIHAALQAQGSGYRRDTIIRNLLDAASDPVTPPEPSTAMEILKIIDANATRQENHLTFLNDIYRIVRRIGAMESLHLLDTIKHPPIRETIAYSIGSELARTGSVGGEIWRKVQAVDANDQARILHIYGEKLEAFHSLSLTEAATLLISLPLSENQKSDIASAYFHSSHLYSPSELLHASSTRGDTWLGVEMFRRGLHLLQCEGPEKTAAYLARSKDFLPPPFYQESVTCLVNTLIRSGDVESANKWQKELPFDQRSPLAYRD